MSLQPLQDHFYVREAAAGVWSVEELYIVPEVRGIIYWMPGRDLDLLVDAGCGILPLLAGVSGIDPARTLAIATHSHFDHIGSLWQFPRRAGHPLEAPIVALPDQVNTQILPFLAQERLLAYPLGAWKGVAKYQIRPAPLTQYLVEGDRIDLGDRSFAVLHTPGHSVGSISLWDEAAGLLLCGDIVHEGHIYTEIPGGDMATLLQTHQRIRALPVQVALPGHFSPLSGERMRQIIATYHREHGG